jgi:hypothetical protein
MVASTAASSGVIISHAVHNANNVCTSNWRSREVVSSALFNTNIVCYGKNSKLKLLN